MVLFIILMNYRVLRRSTPYFLNVAASEVAMTLVIHADKIVRTYSVRIV